MSTLTTKDGNGTLLQGSGGRSAGCIQPCVFAKRGSIEDQMFFLASQGHRCVCHDRRGHGRSSQPWQGNEMDAYADDLAELMESLDLRDVMLVGHSTGDGVVALEQTSRKASMAKY